MAHAIALDASPLNVLRTMRGEIVGARIAYPEVLHLEVEDPVGGLWRLTTQDAEWSPADPVLLLGQSVVDARIDADSGGLRCRLSGGLELEVSPAGRDAGEGPPSWELITPAGVALEFGPGVRWQIGSADRPISSHA